MEKQTSKQGEVVKAWRIVKSKYRIKNNWRQRWAIETGVAPKPGPMKIHPDRKKKRIMSKVLYEMGWGSKQIALWFKEKQQNVVNWKSMPTPEHLQAFEQAFIAAMRDYDMESLANVKLRMNELIPKEERLEPLIKAGEFFRGDKGNKTTQNNTQVNVYTDLLQKYGKKSEMKIETMKLVTENG